jgi:hypothetical protein
MDRLRLTGLIAATFAALVATGPVAEAQYRLEFNYCDRLQAQYLGALRQAGNAGMTGRQMVQMDQIGRQLAQAQQAAQRYGCNGGGFLFFGPRPSPQCPAILAQVNRLSRQLAQMRGNNDFFFFGSSPQAEAARLRDALTNNGCDIPTAGGTRTLCVRTCDGYYFPIEFNASSSRFETDAAACQSMYAADGQAELFVQANSDDVANASSLATGQRYGDQPYAFAYRQAYAPACAAQLHVGLSALKQRYLSLLPPRRKVALAPRKPLPIPQLRRPFTEDPETLANAAGHFTVKPVAPAVAVAVADAPAKSVRMVGPSYYADMFDLSKERRKQEALRPSFSIIGPAAAAEATDSPTATPVTAN